MTELYLNPQLRVEAQVFLLEEDGTLNFNYLEPVNANASTVSYSGSTTGSSYSNNHCSPYQTNWNVRSLVTSPDLLSPIR